MRSDLRPLSAEYALYSTVYVEIYVVDEFLHVTQVGLHAKLKLHVLCTTVQHIQQVAIGFLIIPKHFVHDVWHCHFKNCQRCLVIVSVTLQGGLCVRHTMLLLFHLMPVDDDEMANGFVS